MLSEGNQAEQECTQRMPLGTDQCANRVGSSCSHVTSYLLEAERGAQVNTDVLPGKTKKKQHHVEIKERVYDF